MKNIFLEQISRTRNLGSDLILPRYKLDVVVRFLEIKSGNRILRQDQIAKEFSCSSSTLQRYRSDINMLLPYGIPSNSHKGRQKISNDVTHCERDVKRPQIPQMTSEDLKRSPKDPVQLMKRLGLTD